MSLAGQAWRSECGIAYTLRHLPNQGAIFARRAWLERILTGVEFWRRADGEPIRVLEVGAGTGMNLVALGGWLYDRWARRPSLLQRLHLVGTDLSHAAATVMREEAKGCPVLSVVEADGATLPFPDRAFDLVLSCGFLIHVPPANIPAAVSELRRVCRSHLLVCEYFAPTEEEVPWRGEPGMLWRRDYGGYFLNAGMRFLASGFLWKPVTGADNLTWWLFQVRDGPRSRRA